MLRLATDADVKGPLIHGLQSRIPELDLILSLDFLPEGTRDSDVLAWAAQEGRVLLTFDRSTMTEAAYRRLADGLDLPGIIVATQVQSVSSAIDDIHLIAVCMAEEEIANRVVVYLPFRR